MSRSLFFCLALLTFTAGVGLLLPSAALADESVVGKWEGTVETRRGANEITMDFKDADELQGTWTGPRGTSDLEDVKYEGGELTFVRNLEVQGRAVTLNFTATIDGDTMNVTMKTPRRESQFTMARVK